MSADTLKIYHERELEQAMAHAAAGGQALHMISTVWAHQARTPQCFRRSRLIAHLFDKDRARLVRTARRYGVREILVERPGERGQHVDLCGAPLRRALEDAAQLPLTP